MNHWFNSYGYFSEWLDLPNDGVASATICNQPGYPVKSFLKFRCKKNFETQDVTVFLREGSKDILNTFVLFFQYIPFLRVKWLCCLFLLCSGHFSNEPSVCPHLEWRTKPCWRMKEDWFNYCLPASQLIGSSLNMWTNFWEYSYHNIYFTPRNHQGTIPAGEIRQNNKFAAFWCVFLTKIKVDPESWWNKLSIKQLRKKKIPKDHFTWSISRI